MRSSILPLVLIVCGAEGCLVPAALVCETSADCPSDMVCVLPPVGECVDESLIDTRFVDAGPAARADGGALNPHDDAGSTTDHVDAGVADSGMNTHIADAGVAIDAGGSLNGDSGILLLDAGDGRDAGSVNDAGAVLDAGVNLDAGVVDAGDVDAGPAVLDFDADGVPDLLDNCVSVFNPSQLNTDGDAFGDACDDDDDNDGFDDGVDNCPIDSNPSQLNADGDTEGDVCDPDDDNDAVFDVVDNCIFVVNPAQFDSDNDGAGDLCDDDDDNDGILDDGDGSGLVGDAPCTGNATVACDDNCRINDNSLQADLDDDLIGDACDIDRDGDGVDNNVDTDPDDLRVCENVDGDACDDCAVQNPPDPLNDGPDFNDDGICDVGDSDNDGIVDVLDNCPGIANAAQYDEDGDGLGDVCDNCPGVANPNQTNLGETNAGNDFDAIGDACDPRPASGGDFRIRFIGFNTADDLGEFSTDGGTWSVSNGALHQTATGVSAGLAYYTGAPAASTNSHFVRTVARANSTAGSNPNFGVVIQGENGFYCSQHFGQFQIIYRLSNGGAGAFSEYQTAQVSTGVDYGLAFGQHASSDEQHCARVGSPVLWGDAGNQNGVPGFRVRNSTVTFRYFEVYDLGGRLP